MPYSALFRFHRDPFQVDDKLLAFLRVTNYAKQGLLNTLPPHRRTGFAA